MYKLICKIKLMYPHYIVIIMCMQPMVLSVMYQNIIIVFTLNDIL